MGGKEACHPAAISCMGDLSMRQGLTRSRTRSQSKTPACVIGEHEGESSARLVIGWYAFSIAASCRGHHPQRHQPRGLSNRGAGRDGWCEHLCQHERIFESDVVYESRAKSFHLGDAPHVAHLISADAVAGRNVAPFKRGGDTANGIIEAEPTLKQVQL